MSLAVTGWNVLSSLIQHTCCLCPRVQVKILCEMEKCNLCSFWSLVRALKTPELHELLAIVEYFLFAVLVALYEEPEKPDSALEYPFSLLSLIYWDFLHSTASASWGDLDRLILKLCIENMTFLNAFYLIIPFSQANSLTGCKRSGYFSKSVMKPSYFRVL